MNTSRNLLVAFLVVVSCLFAIQPAGAAAHANLAQDSQACDDIGPLPFRLSTLGVGAGAPGTVDSASMAAPACFKADVPAELAADEDAELCKAIGPTALRLVPVTGLGIFGAGASLNTTACMVAPNLLQPADVQDSRICATTGAIRGHFHVCTSPD